MGKIGRNETCPCGSKEKYKICCGLPISQSSNDLQQHLIDSVEFLIKSCLFYDDGDVAEAKRIALEIRKLVHDTGKSKSILNSLRRKSMSFIETGYTYSELNLASHMGLVIMEMGQNEDGAYAKFQPNLNEFEHNNQRDFDSWWKSIVISDQEKNLFTREDIVLCIADQDGGAHVDEGLEKEYYYLTRKNTVGWKLISEDGEKDITEIHLATVRQIAHEVILTVLKELPDLKTNIYIGRYFDSITQDSNKAL